jgi:hypothetical protein
VRGELIWNPILSPMAEAEACRSPKLGNPNNGRVEMYEKDRQITHFRIVARNAEKLVEFRASQQFAMNRGTQETSSLGEFPHVSRGSA